MVAVMVAVMVECEVKGVQSPHLVWRIGCGEVWKSVWRCKKVWSLVWRKSVEKCGDKCGEVWRIVKWNDACSTHRCTQKVWRKCGGSVEKVWRKCGDILERFNVIIDAIIA